MKNYYFLRILLKLTCSRFVLLFVIVFLVKKFTILCGKYFVIFSIFSWKSFRRIRNFETSGNLPFLANNARALKYWIVRDTPSCNRCTCVDTSAAAVLNAGQGQSWPGSRASLLAFDNFAYVIHGYLWYRSGTSRDIFGRIWSRLQTK